MPGDVYQAPFFFYYVRAAFVQVADEAAYVLFIARNDAGGEHDGVALLYLHPAINLRRKIPKCRAHFAL